MKRKYWTLVSWENGEWHPQFGDYDRATVYQEFIDSYRGTGRTCRIVSSGDAQVEVIAMLAMLEPPAYRD